MINKILQTQWTCCQSADLPLWTMSIIISIDKYGVTWLSVLCKGLSWHSSENVFILFSDFNIDIMSDCEANGNIYIDNDMSVLISTVFQNTNVIFWFQLYGSYPFTKITLRFSEMKGHGRTEFHRLQHTNPTNLKSRESFDQIRLNHYISDTINDALFPVLSKKRNC